MVALIALVILGCMLACPFGRWLAYREVINVCPAWESYFLLGLFITVMWTLTVVALYWERGLI